MSVSSRVFGWIDRHVWPREPESEPTPTPWHEWHPGTQEYWKARALAAERQRDGNYDTIKETEAKLEAAKRERDEYKEAAAAEAQLFNEAREEMNRRGATLAAVREKCERRAGEEQAVSGKAARKPEANAARDAFLEILAILDGEGEK